MTMSTERKAQIKDLMQDVLSVLTIFDDKSIVINLPLIGSKNSAGEAFKQDLLYCIMRISQHEDEIPDACIEYLNDCLDCNMTSEEALAMRRLAKEVDSKLPESGMMLHVFIALDKQLGHAKATPIYVQAMYFLTVGYMQCKDSMALEEIVACCRYVKNSIKLAEHALGETIDFDPVACIHGPERKIVECAIALEDLRQRAIGDQRMDIMKEMYNGNNSEEESDPGYVLEFVKETWDYDYVLEFVKETWDYDDERERTAQIPVRKTAIDELNSLIGLASVKNQVYSMINLMRVNERCKRYGIRRTGISKHMIFTGNPGTGKTSVARVLGKICAEQGLLSKGHLVEVSRAEIVGKYVGHTAVNMKEIFEKAKGGILFIDEAYTLSSECGDYGREAIDTLVKLMEDNAEDTMVIAAGYPQLMQDFLESNPGLKSRFPFVIQFPDYTGRELTKIFKLFCKENDITPTPGVISAVEGQFTHEVSKKKRNFGNARVVRNCFERMLMNQANRIVKNEMLGDRQALCTLVMDDLSQNKMSFTPAQDHPGFEVIKS